MTLKEAIKEMKDQRDALVKHYNRGGEYVKPQLEAAEWAIKCMERCIRLPVNTSECVQVSCAECYKHGDNLDGRVCYLYAKKVDEIRRIHEEGYNGDKQHK